MSPGACTQRSTSASISSGQRISTITLPGAVISPVVSAPGGWMCGSMMITSATKPTRASMMTSRNTVLLPSSPSSNRSRPRMALSELDRGGQQLDRAALEQAHVDHQPEMQERADERRVERDRHAGDQGRDHRADRADVRGCIGAHARERYDEA